MLFRSAVEKILDKKKWGRGHRYLVRWTGYGQDADSWLPASEVEDLAVFDEWLRVHDPERYAREQLEEAIKGNTLTALSSVTTSTEKLPPSEDPSGQCASKAPLSPAPHVPDSKASSSDPALLVPESRAPPCGPARWSCTMVDWLFQRWRECNPGSGLCST